MRIKTVRAETSSVPIRITFYFAEGCWVCDQAQEMLNGLQAKYALDITRVNIHEDDELYDLYRFDVPVLEFEDGSTLYQRIRKKDLLAKLDALAGG